MWQDTVDWIVRNRILIGFGLIISVFVYFEKYSGLEGPGWVPPNATGRVTGYRDIRESYTRSPWKHYLKAEFQINDDTLLYRVDLAETTRFGMGDSIFRSHDTLFFVDSNDLSHERRVLRVYR